MSNNLKNVFSPEEWVDFIASLGEGYVPLPLPDSKYHPGSIISVNYDGPQRGISWLGKLADFEIPDDKLEIINGDVPAVNITNGKEFKGEALLHLLGITAGPSFGTIKKVVLDFSGCSQESLNLIKLGHWLRKNPDVAKELRQELQPQDRFVVSEAVIISKGTYTVYDEKNAKISLEGANIGNFLNITGSLSNAVTHDGKLTVEHPIVFGVRQALYGGYTWEPVRAMEEHKAQKADELIQKLFLENAPMRDAPIKK